MQLRFTDWFGQIGFLLVLPIYAGMLLERGPAAGSRAVAKMLITGGPMFFMFHIGTKAHYFERTLLAGGAKYRPTGRGFVTRHESFAELFRFHAHSHFYKAVSLCTLLTVYACIRTSAESFIVVTWSGWLMALSWLVCPFWFNPMGFQWSKTAEDARDFQQWMYRREGGGDRCWASWRRDETAYLSNVTPGGRVALAVKATRHAAIGVCLMLYSGASTVAVVEAALFMFVVTVVLKFLFTDFHGREHSVRLCKALVFAGVCVAVGGYLVFSGAAADKLLSAWAAPVVALAFVWASST
jgi:hypothetical protein